MPIPTFSRHTRPLSPSTKSISSGHHGHASSSRPSPGRTLSPPSSNTSYSPTITPGGQQQKLNVVTRVAIEGKAKQGQDGAAIKVYLKIALPQESLIPGSTITLFPEENVKILSSQVHPIDSNSVPYNFSSTLSPLLHNAARALNLPARSSESYYSVFGLSPTADASPIASSSRSSKNAASSSTASDNPAPIDDKYTGHILVTGYNISYVLPKEFPPRPKAGGSPTDNEGEGYSRGNSNTPYRSRRPSIGEKNVVQFMAAIDMWVPYVSRPPRSPYLLSIPTPRCLHNNIKLRIFPPTTTSASFASLSSADEDGTSWDLTSDPHVTRSASTRLSRTNSYTHFADDESSDSSTTAGFSDGCGIQGTFPSAERIRVRWAKPIKTVDVPGTDDGRRRVGVKEVKGEMTCTVIGKTRNRNEVEGVVMNVDYKGTCKGVWFPGVATLLGMDVGLEAKGSDVSWVSGLGDKWTVGGGVGYTGYDIGSPPRSRHTSTDSAPQIHISPSPPGAKTGPSTLPSRHNSTSSTSSLLRAPLPVQSVAEYSFEGSSSSPSVTLSSMGSLPPSSNANLLPNQNILEQTASSDPNIRPPGVPITVHLNMNELVTPTTNSFTFTISGTILITPRPNPHLLNSHNTSPVYSSTESETDVDPEPLVLPRFTVLAADSESTTIMIRNEVEAGANVEVYNSSGDIHRDAQTRKTVLQKGGFTKCGEDGGRIALRSIGVQNGIGSGRLLQPPSRPRTPVGNTSKLTPVPSTSIAPSRPRRDGPLMIPSVVATVTPLFLSNGDNLFPNAYAVRVCLPAPADTDSEWLEFGLAQAGLGSSSLGEGDSGEDGGRPPRVEIASASVEGVPVRFETTVAVKQERGEIDLGVPFEEVNGKEWVSWVRVHVGGLGGGVVIVDYVVREWESEDDGKSLAEWGKRKGKRKARDEKQMHIFLPTFLLPLGRLEVNVDGVSGLEITSLRSNLTHEQSQASGRKLLHYSMDELFYPRLSLTIRLEALYSSSVVTNALYKSFQLLLRTTPILLSLLVLFCLLSLGTEIREMKHSLETYSTAIVSGWNDAPETVTVTSTVFTGTRWWFGETPTESETPTSSHLPQSQPTAEASASTPTKPLPLTDIRSSQPTPSTSLSNAAHTSITPTTTPPSESYALLPIHNLPFPWPLQFEFVSARAAVDKVLETLEIVWQTFRKIYHYPLDPT